MGLTDGVAWERENPPVTPATINPKDAVASTKCDLSLFPPVATAFGAWALMDGLTKYKIPANWRGQPISLRVYMAAALRHAGDFMDGEDFAEDSGVHHLAHMIACNAIMIDGLCCGSLIDDRPRCKGAMSSVLADIQSRIKARATRQ